MQLLACSLGKGIRLVRSLFCSVVGLHGCGRAARLILLVQTYSAWLNVFSKVLYMVMKSHMWLCKFAMKSIPPVPLQTPPAMVFIAYLLVGGVILSCILSFFNIFSFMKDEAAPPTQERCCNPPLLQASKLKFLHRGAHPLQGAGQADEAFCWVWTKSHRPALLGASQGCGSHTG